MDVAKRQEVLKVVIAIQVLAVGPFVSCEPTALDHTSFQVFVESSLLSRQRWNHAIV